LIVPDEVSSGRVDKIRIYNRALDQSEVIKVFNNIPLGSTITTPGGPADVTIGGGGELNLAGANTYRGTTYLDEGILTIANATSLGQGAISEQQNLTVTGVRHHVQPDLQRLRRKREHHLQ